jgi:hypothetical protein
MSFDLVRSPGYHLLGVVAIPGGKWAACLTIITSSIGGFNIAMFYRYVVIVMVLWGIE